MRLEGGKGVIHHLLLDRQVRPFSNHIMISYRHSLEVLSSLWSFSFLRRFECFRTTSGNYSTWRTRRFNAHSTLVGKWLSVLLELACGWVIGLKITHQPLQAFLVRIVIFPAGKVSDMACPSDSSCPRQTCLHHSLIQCDRKEHPFVLLLFPLKGSHDLVFHPYAIEGVFREDNQELIMRADSLLNATLKLLPGLQIYRGIPASNAFGSQVGIETFDKPPVFGRIANEAGVVLDGVLSQGVGRGNKGIGQACVTQECLRNVSFRPQEGIRPDSRRAQMPHCYQSFHGSQVNTSKDCLSYYGSAEIGSAEIGSAEIGSVEDGSIEISSAKVGIAEVGCVEDGAVELGIAEIGSGEVGKAEVGKAEVGFLEASSAEVGFPEVGFPEVGFPEVGSSKIRAYTWMLFSPCIPVFYSLPEKIKLLLVCHTVVYLLCGAFIIDRHRPMCKITAFCSFSPGSYEGVHRGLLVVPLENWWLNADFVGGVL